MRVTTTKSAKSEDDFSSKKKREDRFKMIEEIEMLPKATMQLQQPKMLPLDDGHSSTSDVSTISAETSVTSKISASHSSCGYGSLVGSPPPSRTQSPTRYRKVNRFGEDCKDTCLFPISVPIDEAIQHKGPTTWDVLIKRSENAVMQWEEASQLRRQTLKRTVNRVLSASRCFAPTDSVDAEIIFAPAAQIPLRRCDSELNLRLSRQERKLRKTERKRRKSLLGVEDILTTDVAVDLKSSEQIERKINHDLKQSNAAYKVRLKEVMFKQDVPNTKKVCSPRTNAKRHINDMILDNPLSVGVQLTNINKELFLQLSAGEVFGTVVGKRSALRKTNTYGIQSLMAFNEEVKRMAINVITAEKKPEAQSRKIAAFIEVSCVLRKLRNWNSLEVIIKALQSPHVFVLEKAWVHIQSYYPIHFEDFLKLVQIVEACDQHLIRITEEQPSIPSLKLYLRMMKIHCTAQYDLCENKRSWIEPRSIVGWVQRELDGTVLEKEIHKGAKKKIISPSLNPNRNSLLPEDDLIRYIPLPSLPYPWHITELRGASSLHLRTLMHCFWDIFKCEMNLIKGYTCAKEPTGNRPIHKESY